jgi:stage II sporulation protein GA (sporulation sigma-E factor processing peptidase)
MEIYADLFFLINFLMDYFVFWMAAKILRLRPKRSRLALGALFGAAACLWVALTPRLSPRFGAFAAVFILAGGIIIAHAPLSLSRFFKCLLASYVCAFALGGAGFALYYAAGGAAGGTLCLLIGSSLFFYILIKILSKAIGKKFSARRMCRLKIYWDGAFVSLDALIDTGNTLREPISNSPVIVAEFDSVKPLLPEPIKLMFYQRKQDDLAALLQSITGTSFAACLRMIPFSSVGMKKGVLLGFKPDMVELFLDGEGVPASRAVIGICDFKLSDSGAGDGYQALLNPELCG